MDEYDKLLKEIYRFYNYINNDIKAYFIDFCDIKKTNINFPDDFIVSHKKQNGFIEFDERLNKFILSIPSGVEKYKELINLNNDKIINIKNKYDKDYYKYFSKNERSLFLKYYNINIVAYFKSEFLFAYLKKILNIYGINKIKFEDEFGVYEEEIGFSIKDIIIDLETRRFAKKNRLFYLPKECGNDEIIKKLNNMLLDKDLKKILINSNIDNFLNSISTLRRKAILKYEEQEFEKKYSLGKNAFQIEREENILKKSKKEKEEELKELLEEYKRFKELKQNNSTEE